MAGKKIEVVIDAINNASKIFSKVADDILGLKDTAISAGRIIASAIGVEAFAGMVKGAAQAVSEMSRLSQLSGTTATAFQKWSVAAKSVGIDGDKLGDIFKDVQEKFGEFAATGGGGAADFFEFIAPKIGMTAEQFKNLSGPDALQLYVRGLEKANLTQDQMIFYLESLASDSSLLLPILRDSGLQLEEMGTQAERLGRILDEKTIQNIKAFNSALKNLDGASDTFKQQVTGVVGQLDTMTGASNTAAGSIDRLSRGLNKVSSANAPGWLDRFFNTFKLLSAAPVLDAAWGGDAYRKTAETAQGAADTISKAANDVGQSNQDLAEQTGSWVDTMSAEYKRLSEAAKTRLSELTAAESEAKSDLERIRRDRLEMEQRYADAMAKFSGAGAGGASFGAYQQLKLNAQEALRAGDAETARKQAQAALQMLEELAAAGESSYGFQGLAKELRDIESAAIDLEKSMADRTVEEITRQIEAIKTSAEPLKEIKIDFKLNKDGVEKARQLMQTLARELGVTIELQPTVGQQQAQQPAQQPAAPAQGGAGSAQTTVVDVVPVGIAQDVASNLPPVKVDVQPVGIRQDGPASFTSLPAVEADILPKGIRQDGSNSFTNLPAVEAEILPKGIRQDGENSFTNLPAVEVEVLPKGIRQDGDNSFTNLPPVSVEMAVDQASADQTAQAVQTILNSLKGSAVIPVSIVPTGDAAPQVDGYATGGYIRGPGTGTSDSILARLSNGEFVMRAEAVKHYGPQLLSMMNGLQLPKFADGGLVGSLEPSMPHLGSLDLNLGGQTTTVYVESGGALDLRRLAMKKGRTQR